MHVLCNRMRGKAPPNRIIIQKHAGANPKLVISRIVAGFNTLLTISWAVVSVPLSPEDSFRKLSSLSSNAVLVPSSSSSVSKPPRLH